MKRWLAKIVGHGIAAGTAMACALGMLSGCGQQTFLTKEVLDTTSANLLPKAIEDRAPVVSPLEDKTSSPATVVHPERPPRYLSLQEAIAIALENGAPGNRASGINGPTGQADNTLATFGGPGTMNGQTDRLRVLALNPALAGAQLEGSIARFDAQWITSASTTATDAINGIPNLPGYLGLVNSQTAQFQSSVVKPLASGGLANVSFLVDYRNLNGAANNPLAGSPIINPIWATRVSFGIEQPLWRDWGVEINELLTRLSFFTGNSISSQAALTGLNNHQNSVSSFTDRGQTEGILVSRLRFDQNRTEFERNVALLLLNLEIAYWNLYNSYGQLYSYEENVRILQKAWQEAYQQWRAGRMAPEDYYQILGQYEEFRGNRVQSLQQVLAAEITLRAFLGLREEDGTRLVPITPPTLVEMKPDWDACLHDTLNHRPELILARDNLKYHQYLLTIQKNNLKPDLRGYARYEPFGDGNTLTGTGTFVDSGGITDPNNAFRSLATGHLVDWQVGAFMNVPIGFRFEHAAVRAARMELAQSYYFLRDQEQRAARYLATQYQDVHHWYNRIQAHRAERMSYQGGLKALSDQIRVGKIQLATRTVQTLQIQRSYAAALIKEYQAIASYNNALASLEWAKGAMLRYNNVHINEGALPQCVQEKAVDYEKRRTQESLVCLQRPDALSQPGRLVATDEKDMLTKPMSTPLSANDPPTNNGKDYLETPQNLPVKVDDKPAPGKLPELLQSRNDTKTPALAPMSRLDQPGASGVITLDDPTPANRDLREALNAASGASVPTYLAPTAPGAERTPVAPPPNWLPTSPPAPR